ncbi:RNA polymerase III subunit C82 [Trapelia coarctata]|nr:RNA polymerase III subunit C82 [Trapelia coarctata]
MSQHATELCLLLVDDIYGELTSRVFATLMCNGRLTIPSILQHTSLPPRQIKHALAVLLQQHLAFWYTVHEGTTYYEANWAGAYALVRSGKLMKAVEDRLGPVAGEILTSLLLSGHARVADLEKAHSAPSHGGNLEPSNPKGAPNGALPNIHSKHPPNGHVPAVESFQSALTALVRAGLLTTVHESHFRPEADNRAEAEMLVKSWDNFRGDLKGPQKAEYAEAVAKQLVAWRFTNEAATKILATEPTVKLGYSKKRKFGGVSDGTDAPEKRRRSDRAGDSQAVYATHTENLSSMYENNDTTVRVSLEKLAVIARNEKLVELVGERIGKTTALVYSKLLLLLEKDLKCCNLHAGRYEEGGDGENYADPESVPSVSTSDMATAMAQCKDIGGRVAYADPKEINLEMIYRKSTRWRCDSDDEAEVVGEASSDEDDEERQDHNSPVTDGEQHDEDGSNGNTNGTLKRKREKEDSEKHAPRANESSHANQASCHLLTRQHLLLLAEHPLEFATYVRPTHRNPESWTVNFHALSEKLRLIELENTIVSRYSAEGLRIIRILNEKGKLDEKAISSFALMSQKQMRHLLTTMHEQGHLELQEIPKDNNRQPSRTMFLWFFDPERCRMKVLEETYKTMARCMQRVKMEREAVQSTIDKASRTDVVGKEDEYLSVHERKIIEEWREKEEKLLGEVDRLDDLVAVLRDF